MTIEIKMLWLAAIVWTVMEIGFAAFVGDSLRAALHNSIAWLALALWAHIYARWLA